MAYASTVTTEDIDQLQQKVSDFLEKIKNYHPAIITASPNSTCYYIYPMI